MCGACLYEGGANPFCIEKEEEVDLRESGRQGKSCLYLSGHLLEGCAMLDILKRKLMSLSERVSCVRVFLFKYCV